MEEAMAYFRNIQKRKHMNRSGLGLVGVVTSMGILGLMMTTMAAAFKLAVRNQAYVQSQHSMTEIEQNIYEILEENALCTLNFGGVEINALPQNFTQVLRAAGTPEIAENQEFIQQKIRIKTITLENFRAIAPREGLIDLLIYGETLSQMTAMAPKRIVIRTTMANNVPANPNPIQSCMAVGGTSRQIWSLNPDATIFYNGGNVGVGIDAPAPTTGLLGSLTPGRVFDLFKPAWVAGEALQMRVGDLSINSINNGLNLIEAQSTRGTNGRLALRAASSISLSTLNTAGTAVEPALWIADGDAMLAEADVAPPLGFNRPRLYIESSKKLRTNSLLIEGKYDAANRIDYSVSIVGNPDEPKNSAGINIGGIHADDPVGNFPRAFASIGIGSNIGDFGAQQHGGLGVHGSRSVTLSVGAHGHAVYPSVHGLHVEADSAIGARGDLNGDWRAGRDFYILRNLQVEGTATLVGNTSFAGNVWVGGNVSVTGTVTAASDQKLKTEIYAIENPLEKLTLLSGKTFRWRQPLSEEDEGVQMGLIAQDVQKVFPEIVREGRDGLLRVAYMSLIAPIIEAIKLLKTEIENLKIEIAQNSEKANSCQEQRLEIEELRQQLDEIKKYLKKQ